MEHLELEGAEEREWIMMVMVNIESLFKYCKANGVMKTVTYRTTETDGATMNFEKPVKPAGKKITIIGKGTKKLAPIMCYDFQNDQIPGAGVTSWQEPLIAEEDWVLIQLEQELEMGKDC
ncbi:hypothetical protein BT96DRAFT_947347 [Gymnopus androsaceus JB14]|uniref:Uncharacterized protein n=1 Tax=Gymnopus androsaceus JB14 TaxID=1447944 RepID=A0A6A4GSK0_9AGAR|nr:hypothetical protein BT96DRAFT_947347 [Gymnopus androsaceus JB14]